MSPRKRPRAAPFDVIPSSSSTPPSSSPVSTSPPVVPTAISSQTGIVSQASDASAEPQMANSPTGSLTPSVAEITSNSSLYASLRESKNKTRSWYGSWPRKSAASTQVVHETILGGTLKPTSISKLSHYDPRKNFEEGTSGDDLSVGNLALSRKSSTVTLKGAKSSAMSSGHSPLSEPRSVDGLEVANGTKNEMPKAASDSATIDATANSSLNTHETDAMDLTADSGTSATAETPPTLPPAATSASWFSWGGKETAEAKLPTSSVSVLETPTVLKSEDPETSQTSSTNPTEAAQEARGVPTIKAPKASGGIWHYLWPVSSSTTSEEVQDSVKVGELPAEDVVTKDASTFPIPVPAASIAPVVVDTNDAAVQASTTGSTGSTWAFWSRDARTTTGKSPESTTLAEQGEMAVMGERSEARPKPALAGTKAGGSQTPAKPSSIKDMPGKDASAKDGLRRDTTIKEAARNAASIAAAAAVAAAASSRKDKRRRPKSVDTDIDPSAPSTPPTEAQIQNSSKANDSLLEQAKQDQPLQLQTALDTASTIKGNQTSVKPSSTNLLLPTFRSTYCFKENPSILRQITQLLLRTQQPPVKHVFLAKDLPKVTKAVAIGVHGLYPAAYLRPMIGQPTGTSIRFVNHAADAVRRWADNNGCGDCKIEKIALEGEGKIADRVENLWKLLLNWIDHIRTADVVVLACHSQGVPVGFMLLAKLIDLGIVTTARIGVCAMGPFPDYKTGLGILMGSAAELWDFANPESEVSKRYELALKTTLDYGVRVTFVGSIDDQVVPLESAIYSPVHHPYVYRAVFVDGRIYAPDFIAHLVGFACKLRNLGVSDHGLIRELSVPLAGSLYSGEGHSRLYDEPQVYDLAVSHCLETASIAKTACKIKHGSLTNPNPYHLPWIMRGLLEEDFVKTELHDETAELVKQYDEWKPVTKPLKDVKYRLEAVRSRL
ncbi:hypothetical protein SEPCBS57363_000757 [Sporothrix epigloea]|uniref:YMC020W-like alpha/beta hydrolase domain-containing protein n=1 Tax=Sporothrix epigloea TaxID=1892477 RepID=A0ABP0D6K9_9PEZI